MAGQIGSQTDPPYSASKAGLINFAQCAAKDLAPYGVRVNTLCPGMVQTALNRAVWQSWADRQPPEQRRIVRRLGRRQGPADLIPLKRWQTPEDMAAMALFLASPRGQERDGPDGQRRRRLGDALVAGREAPPSDLGCDNFFRVVCEPFGPTARRRIGELPSRARSHKCPGARKTGVIVIPWAG